MSKEATGANGSRLGSSEYWSSINRSTMFGGLMQRDSEPNYYGTLQVIGARANTMVNEIYEDLQKHIKVVRSVPSDHRSALAKQVQALYDICRMGGVICSRSSECVSILNLSGLYISVNPFGSDAAVQNAVRKIKSNSYFSSSECADMVRQAADWSISFAAGSDERKKTFLEDVSQGKGKDFLKEVLDAYRSSSGTADTRGRCGYAIGSRDYRNYVERTVFRQELSTLGSYNYGSVIKGALEVIAGQLERDLTRNERENNYITDDTARNLKEAVRDLNRCGVGTGSAESTIGRLAWFVGGDPTKIRQLQSKLNALGIGARLEEDGVFGNKTANACVAFLRKLEQGSVPIFRWIDPLQNHITGITVGSTKNSPTNNALVLNGAQRFVHFDPPHPGQTTKINGKRVPIDFYHVNIQEMPNGNSVYNWFQRKYNHYEIPEDTYRHLKDLESTGKTIRKGGRKLLIAGLVLDVWELIPDITRELKDADRKLEKSTWSTLGGIGGSWAGAAAGAKIGALAGTMAGLAASVAVPVLSFVGGIVGSFKGDEFGRWVVDITDLGD